MSDFRTRLLQAISDKKLTASELSRLSGVGKSDISNYMNGVYVAKQDKCYLLAQALSVDPGWLMTGAEPVQPSDSDDILKVLKVEADPELKSMLRIWKVSSPKARKAAVEVLKVMSDTKDE